MATHKNETLEEQKRARQEFLELKKMQNGEMDTGPKPSEIAIVPKTPKEKLNNFWFQYKWHTIATIAIVIVLSILITQCATRTKYDLEVVYFTYTTVMDEQTSKIEDYIKDYAEDVDGNGQVNIQVINCSFNNSDNNSQYKYTILNKLQALLVGDQNALLFITDKDSIKYLTQISSEIQMFEDDVVVLDDDFYESTKNETFGKLPDGLTLSCRKTSDTVLENKKGVKNSYKASMNIIHNIQNKHKTNPKK